MMMHGNTKSKPHCLANACFHSAKGECHITESKLKRSEFRKYDKVENFKLYYMVTSFTREIIDPKWCMCILWQFIRYDLPLLRTVNRNCCESGMLSAKHFSKSEHSILICAVGKEI